MMHYLAYIIYEKLRSRKYIIRSNQRGKTWFRGNGFLDVAAIFSTPKRPVLLSHPFTIFTRRKCVSLDWDLRFCGERPQRNYEMLLALLLVVDSRGYALIYFANVYPLKVNWSTSKMSAALISWPGLFYAIRLRERQYEKQLDYGSWEGKQVDQEKKKQVCLSINIKVWVCKWLRASNRTVLYSRTSVFVTTLGSASHRTCNCGTLQAFRVSGSTQQSRDQIGSRASPTQRRPIDIARRVRETL